MIFIHQTYSRLVKCFSLLCTNGCTSFVCGNLNHAAKTAVDIRHTGQREEFILHILVCFLVTISCEYSFVRTVSMAPFFFLFWWSTFHMLLIVFLAGCTVCGSFCGWLFETSYFSFHFQYWFQSWFFFVFVTAIFFEINFVSWHSCLVSFGNLVASFFLFQYRFLCSEISLNFMMIVINLGFLFYFIILGLLIV